MNHVALDSREMTYLCYKFSS